MAYNICIATIESCIDRREMKIIYAVCYSFDEYSDFYGVAFRCSVRLHTGKKSNGRRLRRPRHITLDRGEDEGKGGKQNVPSVVEYFASGRFADAAFPETCLSTEQLPTARLPDTAFYKQMHPMKIQGRKSLYKLMGFTINLILAAAN